MAGEASSPTPNAPVIVLRDAMTADEVAVFLAVDRKTVYAAVLRNEIPHRRLGKRILFSRDAVMGWLRGTVKGAA